MTFIQQNSIDNRNVAQPEALTVIAHTQGTSQSITIGNKVQLNTVYNWFGSFTPTISNDVITLPAGYFYYVESMAQVYEVNSYGYNEHTTLQHYNETSSSLIGTSCTYATSGYGEDNLDFSRDSIARVLLDCSSSAIDITFKITANSGHSHINYNSDQHGWAGMGRTVIWQLNT